MPLYELFCVSRAAVPLDQTRNLLRKTALVVMANGGVVRQFENYGENNLAYKMRKNHEWFHQGRQWTMEFDSNPETTKALDQQLTLDPMVIRHGITVVGKKLEEKLPPVVSKAEAYAALKKKKIDSE